jgi:hypothetical protein
MVAIGEIKVMKTNINSGMVNASNIRFLRLSKRLLWSISSTLRLLLSIFTSN